MSSKTSHSGVRPHGTGIQIEIRYRGHRIRPTLKMEATPKNLRDAFSIKEAIRRDIVVGKLDINEYFDDSKIEKYFKTKYSSKIMVSELLDMWLTVFIKSNDYYPKEYKGHIEQHIKPAIGKIRINDILVSEVRSMQNKLSDKLSNKTVNNIMIPLRHSFSFAFKDEMIEENPMSRIDNLNLTKVKVKPLNIYEVDIVLDIMRPISEHYNFYIFAIWTGLSTGEQLGLKWTDIDFDANTINIDRMWVRGKIRPVKNKYRSRQLELIQPAIDALLALKKSNKKSEWVFIDQNNKKHKNLPWRAGKIASPWNDALTKANIPHRSAYSTRHTYASIMLSAGMSLEWLKEKMGHSNFKMLEEVYASWTKINSKEKNKIRQWIKNGSLNGHMPDEEKDFFL